MFEINTFQVQRTFLSSRVLFELRSKFGQLPLSLPNIFRQDSPNAGKFMVAATLPKVVEIIATSHPVELLESSSTVAVMYRRRPSLNIAYVAAN